MLNNKTSIIVVLLYFFSINNLFSSSQKDTLYRFSISEANEINKIYYQCNGINWKNNQGWPVDTSLFYKGTEPYGLRAEFLSEKISEDDEKVIYKAVISRVIFKYVENLNGYFPSLELLYLKELTISECRLKGKLSDLNLPELEILDFSLSQVIGTLPKFNMPKLKLMDMSNNNLEGELPNFNMPNLEVLNFRYNKNMSGEIPNFNMTKLKILNLGRLSLSGTIPNFNMPELEELIINGRPFYDGSKLSGEIPNFNMPKLKRLFLDGNKLTGSIPNFNMPSLTHLTLFDNLLTGEIPNFKLPKLIDLFLSNNNLSGSIPNFNLPDLISLNISVNKLTGEIPDFINLLNIEVISLSNNQLQGKIPDFDLPKLNNLMLVNNSLTGEIPNFNLPALEYLQLDVNNLSGNIPDFTSIKNVRGLLLSKNNLSGNIPDFDLPKLSLLYLDSNKYTFKALEVNPNKIVNYIYAPQDTTLPITQINNKLKVTVDGSSNTYTWFLNENEVSSGISSSYRPSQTGIYHCEVTNSLLPNLTLSSTTISVIVSGIAVEDQDRFYNYLYTLPPYPQPASSGNIKIPIYWRLGNPVSPDNIKIYNTMGMGIEQENKITIQGISNIHGEIIWDVSGVDAGIYFLEIHHGTSTQIVKIMLE